MNGWIDDLDLPARPIGDWEGGVEIHSYYKKPAQPAMAWTIESFRRHSVYVV
jgi:hypothetical protein